MTPFYFLHDYLEVVAHRGTNDIQTQENCCKLLNCVTILKLKPKFWLPSNLM
jgi:hypothetical protein